MSTTHEVQFAPWVLDEIAADAEAMDQVMAIHWMFDDDWFMVDTLDEIAYAETQQKMAEVDDCHCQDCDPARWVI